MMNAIVDVDILQSGREKVWKVLNTLMPRLCGAQKRSLQHPVAHHVDGTSDLEWVFINKR